MSRLIRRPEDLGEDVANLRFKLGVESSGGNGTGPNCVAHTQLLKLTKSGFDESAKIKCAQGHSKGGQSLKK